MSSVEVRPFRRPDRDQLTALTNAHIAAVLPGVSLSVNTVLSQLEREPGEFIVDPLGGGAGDARSRAAQPDRRGCASAALRRDTYGERFVPGRRRASVVSLLAGCAVLAGCHRCGGTSDGGRDGRADGWEVRIHYADGALPAPGVYGVPEQWPHVRDAYERAGFVHEGRVEVVYIAEVDDLRPPGKSPLAGLEVRHPSGSTDADLCRGRPRGGGLYRGRRARRLGANGTEWWVGGYRQLRDQGGIPGNRGRGVARWTRGRLVATSPSRQGARLPAAGRAGRRVRPHRRRLPGAHTDRARLGSEAVGPRRGRTAPARRVSATTTARRRRPARSLGGGRAAGRSARPAL